MSKLPYSIGAFSVGTFYDYVYASTALIMGRIGSIVFTPDYSGEKGPRNSTGDTRLILKHADVVVHEPQRSVEHFRKQFRFNTQL